LLVFEPKRKRMKNLNKNKELIREYEKYCTLKKREIIIKEKRKTQF
jgi:hypothetical protein